jgi:hypothetical protein
MFQIGGYPGCDVDICLVGAEDTGKFKQSDYPLAFLPSKWVSP